MSRQGAGGGEGVGAQVRAAQRRGPVPTLPPHSTPPFLPRQAEANLGMAMIYTLIGALQEWIEDKVWRRR